ncbi:ABC transporter permease [Alicyclobacillus cellulosilyticus]|uniref:ABC transporter permease n=1 Tax=Alicyclobacillus cellulosilyticus TaxID=1003997 RepID=A0A917K2L9_9BACL|nr:sugar ABC transporter permease [Alicyclobacillus cellulosilyticus]GGI95305.1 ABC transporter permease [Alicyclobacillus cellulosilyticus]
MTTNAVPVTATAEPRLRTARRVKDYAIAYSFIAPWLLGFLCFTIGPMIVSFLLSFTQYSVTSAPKWIGLRNYVDIFTVDPQFWIALGVTLKFVIISVPLKLAFSLAVAMLLHGNYRGVGVYRTIFYVPSLIGGSVAVAEMWRQLFGLNGAVNNILQFLFGVPGDNWIANPNTALWTLILLVIWQFGSPMLIFLAGLRQIPKELYEAAAVDGANGVVRFFRITVPMLTPIIFFNLVMQLIHGFTTFTQSYLITSGGPLNRTLFYALYLYQHAFQFFDMGYACALAWILLAIVGTATALVFKSSSAWVYYESERGA